MQSVPIPGAVWIKSSFQGFVYYHSLKNSPFDQEPGDSMLCPLKMCSYPQDPSAVFVSFESPVYFGNSAIAPEVPLMSIEFNIFHLHYGKAISAFGISIFLMCREVFLLGFVCVVVDLRG